ncbi:spore coat protein CotJB [Paenibacillus alkaliterrae]|uniref:spore coat protein CotJB n=1 Tax=Paenibacillus alkaliterrae TaxID=320909 RepID=UPI001F27ECC3|nr:spore coat protein CotJB [Paenibacillus alkaliterrae]MCF2937690.1 spore coat protein CotJB [Paenibacillus alkaliterrae]
MNKALDNEFYQLLHELQSVDFVLVELNLYLDTHPMDANAIQQYNHYAQLRQKIAQLYESKYGPLQNFGQSYSSTPWCWNDAPWPWQV